MTLIMKKQEWKNMIESDQASECVAENGREQRTTVDNGSEWSQKVVTESDPDRQQTSVYPENAIESERERQVTAIYLGEGDDENMKLVEGEAELNDKSTNWHSMEISRQRCERAKKRATEPDAMPSGTAPYGYQVVQEGEQKYYVVDPDTAPFVRMIFKWAALGLSCGQIADRMIVLGVSTPGQLRDGKPSDPSKWNAHTILKILQNPNYTGSIFIGRMQQALYKAQPRRNTDAGEWTIRKNTHEPLVTREDFDIIQKYIADKCKRGERQKM